MNSTPDALSTSIKFGRVIEVIQPVQPLKPRGTSWPLSETFLRAPRYRLFVTNENNFKTNFSVTYRRSRNDDKLGLTIGNVEWENVVCNLHSKGPYDPLPAKESGVEVGDVLAGVNNELFCPTAEVQDIIDILNSSWLKKDNYVTLHFSRFKQYVPFIDQAKSSASYLSIASGEKEAKISSEYIYSHRALPYLLDQNVIPKNKIRYVDTILQRLKERVLQWDMQTIADRMDLWKLDVFLTGEHEKNPILRMANSLWERKPNSSHEENKSNFSSFSEHYSNSPLGTNMNHRRESFGSINYHKGSKLRPALSVRILRAEEQPDCVMYVMWVLDIRSGVDWLIRRRFREFFDFREVITCIVAIKILILMLF